jgi:S1-C subfamily serine protease
LKNQLGNTLTMADINHEFQTTCTAVATGQPHEWRMHSERLQTIDLQGKLPPITFLLFEVIGRARLAQVEESRAAAQSYRRSGGDRESLSRMFLACPEMATAPFVTFSEEILSLWDQVEETSGTRSSSHSTESRGVRANASAAGGTVATLGRLHLSSASTRVSLGFALGSVLCMLASLWLSGDLPGVRSELSPNATVTRYQTSIPYIAPAGGGHGSGFLIRSGARLWVATNLHVITSGTSLDENSEIEFFFLELDDGVAGYRIRFSKPLRDFRRHQNLDIAVVDVSEYLPEFQKWGVRPLPIRSASSEVLGEEVYVIGHPGAPTENLNQLTHLTVTRGIVSGFRNVNGIRVLQTDAAVNPGNSGGPILDRNGKVIAMTTFKFRDSGFEGDGFGLMADDIQGAVESGVPLNSSGGLAAFDGIDGWGTRFLASLQWDPLVWFLASLGSLLGIFSVLGGFKFMNSTSSSPFICLFALGCGLFGQLAFVLLCFAV